MSEKLKVAIRLSADPKAVVKAFAELKKKSLATWRALDQTQEELKALTARIKATGGGLSPRMRGTPADQSHRQAGARFIPA